MNAGIQRSGIQGRFLSVILGGLLCAFASGCTSVVVKPAQTTKFPAYQKSQPMPIYTTIGIANMDRVSSTVGQPLLPRSSLPPHMVIGSIEMNPPALYGLGSICRRAQSEAGKLGADAIICTYIMKGSDSLSQSMGVAVAVYDSDNRLNTIPVHGPLYCKFSAIRFTEKQ